MQPRQVQQELLQFTCWTLPCWHTADQLTLSSFQSVQLAAEGLLHCCLLSTELIQLTALLYLLQ